MSTHERDETMRTPVPPATMSRRRALALLVAVPTALVALPAALEAAPVGPSDIEIRSAALDAVEREHGRLADALGLSGREFADAWLLGLVRMADARDAYAAEHGERARAIWDDAIGDYLDACNDAVALVCTKRQAEGVPCSGRHTHRTT